MAAALLITGLLVSVLTIYMTVQLIRFLHHGIRYFKRVNENLDHVPRHASPPSPPYLTAPTA